MQRQIAAAFTEFSTIHQITQLSQEFPVVTF